MLQERLTNLIMEDHSRAMSEAVRLLGALHRVKYNSLLPFYTWSLLLTMQTASSWGTVLQQDRHSDVHAVISGRKIISRHNQFLSCSNHWKIRGKFDVGDDKS